MTVMLSSSVTPKDALGQAATKANAEISAYNARIG